MARVGAWVVLVLFGAVGVWMLVNLNERREANRKIAALTASREELRKAVVLAGTALVARPAGRAMDYDAASNRFAALYERRLEHFESPELAKTWGNIEADARRGLVTLDEIGSLDRTKPSGYQIVAEVLQNDDHSRDDEVGATVAGRVVAEMNKNDLEKKFRSVEEDLNGSIGGLQEIANGLYRDEVASAVSVRYLPSWDGAYWGDSVELRNTSSSNLENAIVFISVYGKDGTPRTHMHYASQWPAGQTLSALYPFEATDYADAQAGALPDHVEVAVYQPSGVAKTSYALSQADWDAVVKSYCARLQFTGTQLGPYEEAVTSRQYAAGYQFSFKGLWRIPVSSVEVRFTSSAGDVASERWTYDPGSHLSADTVYPFRSEKLNGDPPSRVEFVLRFPGTGYEHVLTAE